MDEDKKYVCACSFGKDSMATVILAIENNEALDMVIYCEVMFSKDISAEYPEHVDFIYNKAIPWIEKHGIPVVVKRSEKTFLDCFFHRITRSKTPERVGQFTAFPLCGKCTVNRDCKVPTLEKIRKELPKNSVQYIGIALDEPKRLKRLQGGQVSLLAKYGYTEQMALELCKKYDLLSPIYSFATRNGCWFCANVSQSEIEHLYNNKLLWDLLLWLDKAPNMVKKKFNRTHTIAELDEIMRNKQKESEVNGQ